VYRSNRLSAALNLRSGRFSLYSYYLLRFDKSDAEASTFPSQPYRIGGDYGRADDDTRHSGTVRGTANLPRGFSASGYIRAMSGAPFNIVVDQDLNGDTQFNDRPAFATDLTRPSVVVTRLGVFDMNPQPGQAIIPRNLGQGPAYVLVTLAAGKSFGLGAVAKQAGAPSAPRATAEFWVESQNLLNHANLGPPVGILNSPLFGTSLAVTGASTLSPDRTVDMQLSFRF
jgi:hypothetical protein